MLNLIQTCLLIMAVAFAKAGMVRILPSSLLSKGPFFMYSRFRLIDRYSVSSGYSWAVVPVVSFVRVVVDPPFSFSFLALVSPVESSNPVYLWSMSSRETLSKFCFYRKKMYHRP